MLIPSLAPLAPLALASLLLQEAPAAQPYRVTGRLVDGNGRAVAGARVQPRASRRVGPRSQRVSRWTNTWSPPTTVTTGTDGRFELEFVPDPDGLYMLDVEHDDYAKIGWAWQPPVDAGFDARFDAGDVVLELPGVITGFIVDREGDLLVDGWRVGASERTSFDPPRRAYGTSVAVDPSTGTFRVADLAPGPIKLRATGPGGSSARALVETSADETTEVRLVFDGPGAETRVSVKISSAYGFEPERGSVRAFGPDGRRRTLTRIGSGSLWRSDEVARGVYTVAVDDPRFEPVRIPAVQTGVTARVQLDGSAALRLDVVDEVSGKPLDAYGLRLAYPEETSWGTVEMREYRLRRDGTPAPLDGLVEGIVPGDLVLHVRAGRLPTMIVPIAQLAPNETRSLRVTMPRGLTLEGVVLAEGVPAAGVTVQLTRGSIPGHDLGANTKTVREVVIAGIARSVSVGYRDAETTTDEAGRFSFARLAPANYSLRAFAGPWVFVDGTFLAAGQEPVVLELPAMGRADVKVLLPEGTETSNLRVHYVPVEQEGEGLWLRVLGQPLRADGTCSLEGLPVGQLELALRVDYAPDGHGTRDSRSAYFSLGTIRVARGQTTEATLDATATFPSTVAVRVLVQGEGHAGTRLRLNAEPEVLDQTGLYGTALGWFHTGPPGAYTAHVFEPVAGWGWDAPEPVVTRPGEALELELDVPALERSVRVVGPDGQPIAGADMTWWNDALAERFDELANPRWELRKPRGTTDEAGLLGPLSLPPGPFRFVRTHAIDRQVEVVWEPGSEPLTVVLPKR